MVPALHHSKRAGFSLVEVTIAIGIFAFCIVGTISLLGIALESSRSSHVDSALVAVMRSMESELRALPFDDADPKIATLANESAEVFVFDSLGNRVSAPGSAFYQVRVERLAPASVESLTSILDDTPAALSDDDPPPVPAPGLLSIERHYLWMVKVSYPMPQSLYQKTFLVGLTLLGSGRLAAGSNDSRFYD